QRQRVVGAAGVVSTHTRGRLQGRLESRRGLPAAEFGGGRSRRRGRRDAVLVQRNSGDRPARHPVSYRGATHHPVPPVHDRALYPIQADLTPPPAGTLLFQENFEDNAFASRGWYDNTSMVTTTAEHLPTGTSAAEMHFTVGSTIPVQGGSARHLFAPTPTLYVSFWVKYSSNWVGSGH